MFRPLFKMPRKYFLRDVTISASNSSNFTTRIYNSNVCSGCNGFRPASNWPSWIPQTEKQNSLHHQIKRKRKKSKRGNFSSDLVTNTAGSSSSPPLHRLNRYVHLLHAAFSFVFPICSFSLLPSFLFRLKWISQYFRVLVCEGVHERRFKKKKKRTRRRRACFGDVSSLMGHWFFLTGVPLSRIRSLTERWGEKESKNQRIKEKTRTEREVHRARAVGTAE